MPERTSGGDGPPDWWLDELAHAGNEHLDPAYVAGYDRKAGHDPQADLDILCRLGLDGDSTLVDLGAGTGRLTLAAARICRRLVAVDVSTAMLGRLRADVGRAGLANVEVVQAGFLSYVHQGPAADFVYTRHALHQLPDFWKAIALARVAGILRPGGVLLLRDLVYTFDPAQAAGELESWLASAAGSTADGWTRPELATHVREEHSTFSWLLEPMLDKAGFRISEVTPSRHPATYASYVCVKR
ncbi:class I SAM-dependent methyltransferase [Plantactinospora soyae]|uniref:Ubiquinone/menaquinone biosynthesis C-methylase UbiE n=1 Tax=Plantactinospora soyae TaxID=1544732 RepID=A0A927M9M7_9ACTN|nr:class I SAM-dependent methyltransferase [Plantactinospora soyae]MBE1490384.1 ubiquinone/menaquinone biosynthesis C-methylase UbiE [Plantactinospora soyae]